MELKEVAGEILKKHGKAMCIEMVEQVAIEALKQAAAKSATPVDDAIVAVLAEPLKQALKELIEKA